jgi:hypothetical protein
MNVEIQPWYCYVVDPDDHCAKYDLILRTFERLKLGNPSGARLLLLTFEGLPAALYLSALHVKYCVELLALAYWRPCNSLPIPRRYFPLTEL